MPTDYSLTRSPSTVTEGGQVTFTIRRTGDKPAETVYFSTLSDGSATYNEGDYATTSGGRPANIAVSFSSGATSRTVTLNILEDGISDSGEEFRAIVQRSSSDPVSTYLDRSSYVTIEDAAPDTSYSLTRSPSTVTEGGQVTFTITRSGDKPAETVYFSTLSDGSATYGEGDYATTSGGQPANIAVSFSSGTTSRTVTLNILNDGVSDSGEQFRAIVQRSASDPVSTYLDRSSYVTIEDAAPSTSYSLSPSVDTAVEGGQVTFTITRSGDKPAETVYFSTLSDDTATYGEGDYATTSGGSPANIAVDFSAGTTSRTVTLNILSDGIADSGEQFRAIVQRSTSDSVSTYLDRSSYVAINDAAPATGYTLTPSSTSTTEGGQITFTITRSGDKPAETVYFSTLSDGTATYGEGDYATTSGGSPANIAVSFSAGAISRTVTLNILSDGVVDAGEQFRAILQRSASDPVSTYLDRSAYVTIADSGTVPSGSDDFRDEPGDGSAPLGSVSVGGSRTGIIGQADANDTYGDKDLFAVELTAGKTYQFTLKSENVGGASLPSGLFTVRDPANFDTPLVTSDSGSNVSETFCAEHSGTYYVRVGTGGAASDKGGYRLNVDETSAQGTTYSLTPASQSVTEGGQMVFTIARSGERPAETVYFSTLSDDTASYAEGDYRMAGGGIPRNIAVSFASGQQLATVTLDILTDSSTDSGERFRAIVQRNSSDAAGTFLDRSAYVAISEPTETANKSELGGITEFLVWAHVLTPAQANSNAESQIFRYPVGVNAIVSEGRYIPGTTQFDDDYYNSNDFGSQSPSSLSGHEGHQHKHLGEDWNSSPGGDTDLGDSVYAIGSGTVVYARPNVPGQEGVRLGKVVVIEHIIDGKKLYSLYAHLDEIRVKENQKINDPIVIGTIGKTGAAGGIVHLHFEILEGDWQKYLENGVSDGFGGIWGYTDGAAQPHQTYSYNYNGGGSVTWQDPSDFIDRTMLERIQGSVDTSDIFSGSTLDVDSITNIFRSGQDVIVQTVNGARKFLLESFEEIRVIGSSAIETLNIGSLFGTTIRSNTIYFDAGAGNDTINGVEADRRIVADGGTGSDNLIGGSDSDFLNGGADADRLIGGNGLDRLDGGTGADRLEGGQENDLYIVDNEADLIVEANGKGTDSVESSANYSLTPYVENLTLTGSANIAGAGNNLYNTIIGNSGANVLAGREGEDRLDGGLGADTMKGGLHNDVYVVDDIGDKIFENPGEGTDAVEAWINYALASEVEILRLMGTTALNGTGNTLANTLIGNGASNRLDGGVGADRMEGGNGEDVYVVDNESDRVIEVAGKGNDTIESTVSYSLTPNVENLTLLGSAAIAGAGNELANRITGNGAANILAGREGADRLDGGGGADTMKGGIGDDVYVVDNAADKIQENAGEGADSVEAWVSYALASEAEAVRLMGSANINATGNTLANSLRGNSGNNELHGGLGSDTLSGGDGLDSFWFETALGASNIDTITDFHAPSDTIYLDRTIFTGVGTNGSLAAGAFRLGTAAADADDRILYDPATGKLWYDADGTGAVAAVQFATLKSGLSLTSADFFAVP